MRLPQITGDSAVSPPETMAGPAPLVSIGLPVYNGEHFIARCLESLCGQDYPNIEIIVSDNASKDRTLECCREVAAKFPHIRIHRQDHNAGVQKNFKKVLELARGDYFCWAGVDDLWEKSFVRVLVDDLENHPEANLSMSAFDRVLEDGRHYDTQRFLGRDSPNGRTHAGMLFRVTSPLKFNLFLYGLFRAPFIRNAARYFPDIPAWDRVFMCVLSLATPIRYVDEVLHRHSLHPVPLKERYPDEKVFQKKNGNAFRFLSLRTIRSICVTTLRADIVPAHRKWLLLAGVPHYLWEVLKHHALGFLKTAMKKLLKLLKHRLLSPARSAVKLYLSGQCAKADALLSDPTRLAFARRHYWRLKRFCLIKFWSVGRKTNGIFRRLRRSLIPGRRDGNKGISNE